MIGFVSINSVIVQKSIVGQILDAEKTWRKLSEDTVIGDFSYLPLSDIIRQDTQLKHWFKVLRGGVCTKNRNDNYLETSLLRRWWNLLHSLEHGLVKQFRIVSGNLGGWMSHNPCHYFQWQSFVQEVARCGVSSNMGMKGLCDSADVSKYLQVCVVSLIGYGRKHIIIFLGYGYRILEKDSHKPDPCLQSFIVDVDIWISRKIQCSDTALLDFIFLLSHASCLFRFCSVGRAKPDQRKKSVGKISRWTDRRCFGWKAACRCLLSAETVIYEIRNKGSTGKAGGPFSVITLRAW